MEKFRNQYRVPTARLQKWDYQWPAAYFITVCTKNRLPYFGAIENGKMALSNVGVLADVLWHEIKNHTKNIVLGEFVVMPNHIHGILIFKGNEHVKETTADLSLSPSQNIDIEQNLSFGKSRFQNQGKNSLSSIVGGYKSAVSKHANRMGFEFSWQPRFHDHIIRDEKSYEAIANYIVTNPLNWDKDKFFGTP